MLQRRYAASRAAVTAGGSFLASTPGSFLASGEGDPKLARATLLALLEKDLRCIDAHVHLGNFAFDKHPKRALRHYEVGIAIGEQALGPNFEGVLPWGVVENRPFLRCMHGYGVTAWKLGRFQEAAAMFRRMLWINPADQQGIRLIVEDAERGRRWTP